MKILSRYMFKQCLLGMGAVLSILVTIVWLTQSLRFIEGVLNNGASIGHYLVFTLLLMPSFIMLILPIALFIAILFTYNKLINDRELSVMRAAGCSNWTIASPALLLATLTVVFGLILSLWVTPLTFRQFFKVEWSLRNDIGALFVQEGMFNDLSNGIMVYIRSKDDKGALLGILIQDGRDPHNAVTYMAEQGAFVNTPTGPKILMINGNRQQVTPQNGHLSLLYFDQYTIDFGHDLEAKGIRTEDVREKSTWSLLNEKKKPQNLLTDRTDRIELLQRFITPFYALSFTLVALCCLILASFNRRGQVKVLLSAIGIVLVVEANAVAAANLGLRSLHYVPLLFLNVLVPIVICIWFMGWFPLMKR